MLPADITGSEIYVAAKGEFEFRKGPVFANLVLADEINRAPAKVQSALLEAMAERQVSMGGRRYQLPELFMVRRRRTRLSMREPIICPKPSWTVF